MWEYVGGCRGVQEGAVGCRSVQEDAGGCRRVQKGAGGCRRVCEDAGGCRGGAGGYGKMWEGAGGCGRVQEGAAGCRRLQEGAWGCSREQEGAGGRRGSGPESTRPKPRRERALSAGEGGGAGGEPGTASLLRRRRCGAGGGLSPARPALLSGGADGAGGLAALAGRLLRLLRRGGGGAREGALAQVRPPSSVPFPVPQPPRRDGAEPPSLAQEEGCSHRRRVAWSTATREPLFTPTPAPSGPQSPFPAVGCPSASSRAPISRETVSSGFRAVALRGGVGHPLREPDGALQWDCLPAVPGCFGFPLHLAWLGLP